MNILLKNLISINFVTIVFLKFCTITQKLEDNDYNIFTFSYISKKLRFKVDTYQPTGHMKVFTPKANW